MVTKTRRDKTFLAGGLAAAVALAVATYVIGLGLAASLTVLIVPAILARLAVLLYFERFMAFRTFEYFRSEKILHECTACGACCHLKVNLGKDDVDRILRYSKQKGLSEIVMEKHANKYWLKRKSGECCFLAYLDGKPRCQIYTIRPVACRLYPLIPAGSRLKADPLCPGFNEEKGQTFKEFLRSQEVVAYVRTAAGKG